MAHQRTTLLAALAAWLVWTGAPQAHAGPTSAQKCESAIGIASGKYALCLQKAQAKYALVGDVTGRDRAITKCDQKFEKTYAKAFDKFGASCPTAEPVESFKTHLAECSDATADAVGGSFPPPSSCGNGVLEGDERCDQWGTDMSLAPGVSCLTEGFDAGTLACAPGCLLDTDGCRLFACGDGLVDAAEQCDDGNDIDDDACDNSCMVDRFVDNGDGTITDTYTGLMWEKKSDNGDIHDKDNLYLWSPEFTGGSTNYNPEGTLFTEFLPALYDGEGFAGHTDWRLASTSELLTICAPGAGIYPAFKSGAVEGCSGSEPGCSWSLSNVSRSKYLSANENEWYAGGVLAIDFESCSLSSVDKIRGYPVRAVRDNRGGVTREYDFTGEDFGSSDMILAGNAAWVSDPASVFNPFPLRLRLTENATWTKGAAWLSWQIDPGNDWGISFRFQITSPVNGGADGIALYFQSEGDAYDPGLFDDPASSYFRITIDTWQNEGETSNNSLRIEVDGQEVHRHDLSWIHPGDSDEVFHLEVTHRAGYGISLLRLIGESGENPAYWLRDVPLDLASLGSSVWVGVAATTGGAAQKHDIRTFKIAAAAGR